MDDFLQCYLPPEMKEWEGPAAMHLRRQAERPKADNVPNDVEVTAATALAPKSQRCNCEPKEGPRVGSRKPREPAAVKLEETAQGQDISCNGRGRQGEGRCSIAEISLCGLFYFGSVPKADDLNGSLSLVDAIVKQVISVD